MFGYDQDNQRDRGRLELKSGTVQVKCFVAYQMISKYWTTGLFLPLGRRDIFVKQILFIKFAGDRELEK